jgi:hypothetical protein
VGGGEAADDVAAADDDGGLDPELRDVDELVGDPRDDLSSMPNGCEPIRASPESLSRMRR